MTTLSVHSSNEKPTVTMKRIFLTLAAAALTALVPHARAAAGDGLTVAVLSLAPAAAPVAVARPASVDRDPVVVALPASIQFAPAPVVIHATPVVVPPLPLMFRRSPAGYAAAPFVVFRTRPVRDPGGRPCPRICW